MSTNIKAECSVLGCRINNGAFRFASVTLGSLCSAGSCWDLSDIGSQTNTDRTANNIAFGTGVYSFVQFGDDCENWCMGINSTMSEIAVPTLNHELQGVEEFANDIDHVAGFFSIRRLWKDGSGYCCFSYLSAGERRKPRVH